MEAEKVTEVEMKELTPEVQDDKDAEKDKMEKTKEAEKKAEEKEMKEEEGNVYSKLNSPTEDVYNPLMPSSSSKRIKEAEKKAEEKEIKEEEEGGNVYSKLNSPTEDVYNPVMASSSSKRNKAEKVEKKKKEDENEEAEEDLYCKLKDPSENVYMATMTNSSAKHKDVYKKVRLYKRISAVSIILAVLLLAVVLALALKLNGKCPENTVSKCTCELCQPKCPPKVLSGCIECEKGWGRFEKSCYFKSKERLNWQESREACQEKGGDLAVIDNEHVQKFLTENSNMLYWIGLRYSEEQQWMWIDNTAPIQMYWDPNKPISNSQNSCALLNGGMPLNNWFSNHCEVISHYFCQKSKSKE